MVFSTMRGFRVLISCLWCFLVYYHLTPELFKYQARACFRDTEVSFVPGCI